MADPAAVPPAKVGDVITEPQPEGDLLDLVRQYGTSVLHAYDEEYNPREVARRMQRAEALFARIKAEVQRPHDEAARLDTKVMVERLRDERDYWERRFNEEAQRGDQQAQALLTARVEARTQINAEIAPDCGTCAAWADRLARAALRRTGVRETEEASGNEELWQLALDALSAAPPQDGPVVLRLPEVPDGAAWLKGGMSGHRWSPTEFGRWVDEETGQVRGLLPLLEREGSVTVEMAPPREPRTWPKLDEAPVGLAHVEVNGREFTSVDGAYWDEVGSCAEYAWPMLLALGDVTEVVER